MTSKSRKESVERTVALCYVRRSLVRDEKDMVSPEIQRQNIKRICEAHGWQPEFYEDVEKHKSGMHEKNRPGWLALKARLDDPDIIALVSNDLSRLHRKGWRIGDLLDFVDQHGIKLVLADPNKQIDFSTPHGRMIAQLSAIFDEWYAVDVSLRRKANIAHRKSLNITVGRPPFGTKRNKEGYLIRSPEGAWLLPDGRWEAGQEDKEASIATAIWRGYFDCAEQILRLFAQGKNRSQICEELTAQGYAFRGADGNPTPLEADDIRRVTHNWVEYGGLVMDNQSISRHYEDYDLEEILVVT
jgi:DNA invertase Pin-like site-specific DNA recombinase